MRHAREPRAALSAAVRIPRVNTYVISTDPTRLQPAAIHAYLTRSYWSPGIPQGVVERAIANSLCFGIYLGETQVGFARVVTDKATFAYLADVYVLEEHRGQGLSKRLVRTIQAHPELQGLRRFLLATRDAHGLYAQFGFAPPASPQNLMEIRDPDPYGAGSTPSPDAPLNPAR
jgi:GNAT superfamily N-acetyltransferase